MIYWNVYKNNFTDRFVYGDETTPMGSVCTFITKYKTEKEAKETCERLNKQIENTKSCSQKAVDTISLKEFYFIASQVGWRDEFEKWLKQILKPCHINTLFPFDTWLTFYTDFAKENPKVLWLPFRKSSAEFNFVVCEFISDGFYNYFEPGQQFSEEDWKFIRAYRNKQDAKDFVKAHNNLFNNSTKRFTNSLSLHI